MKLHVIIIVMVSVSVFSRAGWHCETTDDYSIGVNSDVFIDK